MWQVYGPVRWNGGEMSRGAAEGEESIFTERRKRGRESSTLGLCKKALFPLKTERKSKNMHRGLRKKT